MRAERPPTPSEVEALAGYAIDSELLCTRKDGRPCRIEALRELAPSLPVSLGDHVWLGVESLGQLPAADCVRLAKEALVRDALELMEMLEHTGCAQETVACSGR